MHTQALDVRRCRRLSLTSSLTLNEHSLFQAGLDLRSTSTPLLWKRCLKRDLTSGVLDRKNLLPSWAKDADILITMGCGDDCPYVPGLRRDDWPLPDPKDQSIDSVRQISEEIRKRVLGLLSRERFDREV